MVDRDALIRLLMATFLGEVEEHVRALNHDLLALEQAGTTAGPELLQSLFRTAHSLKGAARTVNVRVIELAFHRAEELLAALRDGAIGPEPALLELLLAATDGLADAGVRLREERALEDGPLAALLPRLEAKAAEVGKLPRRVAAPVAAPVPVAAPAPAPVPAPADTFVRVPADKLDTLLAASGELRIARGRLVARQDELTALRDTVEHWRGDLRDVHDANADRWKQAARALERLQLDLGADQRTLAHAAERVDAEVRRLRLQPFADACAGLRRTVRDLSQALGKQAELIIEAGDVELDRGVLEGLKDPLLHLLRNALDHGVEMPAERMAAGKPAQARVTVTAALVGARVEVAVCDDGRGLDLAAIAVQAQRRGLPATTDPHMLANYLFLPGFSTARLITEVSGRGIGLDVVKTRVEALHGTVQVTSTPGQGTEFRFTVPLTLSTVRALLVSVGDHTYALPTSAVQALLRVDPDKLHSVQGRDVLTWQDTAVPVVALADALGLGARPVVLPGERLPVVVLGAERPVAFAVDELLMEQEIVIKALGPRLRRVRHVSGVTTLPSGRLALLLHAAGLLRTVQGLPASAAFAAQAAGTDAPRHRLLVVDDSVTTRSLVRHILQSAGYEVIAAADGVDAWQLLSEKGADLVVTDLEMPRMDGFALTEMIRKSLRFRELPVVLVTALETDVDKARGLALGANAYLLKSSFDQSNLLQTIAQLL